MVVVVVVVSVCVCVCGGGGYSATLLNEGLPNKDPHPASSTASDIPPWGMAFAKGTLFCHMFLLHVLTRYCHVAITFTFRISTPPPTFYIPSVFSLSLLNPRPLLSLPLLNPGPPLPPAPQPQAAHVTAGLNHSGGGGGSSGGASGVGGGGAGLEDVGAELSRFGQSLLVGTQEFMDQVWWWW